MVACVNGTIKKATVKATTDQNIDEMKQDLAKFLIYLEGLSFLKKVNGKFELTDRGVQEVGGQKHPAKNNKPLYFMWQYDDLNIYKIQNSQ